MNNSTLLTIIGLILAGYSIYLQKKDARSKTKGKKPSSLLFLLFSATKGFLLNRRKLVGFALTVLMSILWGVSNVSLRFLAINNVDVFFTSSVMLITGALSCFFLSYFFKSFEPSNTKNIKIDLDIDDFCLLVIGNSVNFLAFIYAVYFVSSSQVIILNKVNPLFVALLLSLFLKEKVSKASLASIVSIICGIYILVNIDNFSIFLSPNDNLYGSFFAILAGFSFAVFTIGLYKTKSITNQSPIFIKLKFIGYILLYSYVILITIALFIGFKITYDPFMILIVILNGIRLAVVYALYQEAVRLTHPIFVSVAVSLEVVFTIIIEIIWLNEKVHSHIIIGAILIMGAIWSMMAESSKLETKFQEMQKAK